LAQVQLLISGKRPGHILSFFQPNFLDRRE